MGLTESLGAALYNLPNLKILEMDLMMMHVSSELFSGKVLWPIFLLANKVVSVMSMWTRLQPTYSANMWNEALNKQSGTEALTEGNAIHKKKLSLTFFHLSKEEFSMQSCSSPRFYENVKAAIAVIRNIRGLTPGQDFKKHGAFVDLFDFLQHCFGFQEANVANQREHLILLLANMQTRQTHHQT
ncbi:hypothetical protein P8452_51863 [Trifolium repens]|nr:hypothetical protein P8452_51863 [Trifolium repens]